ncbi:pre-rRNA processing protein [Blastocladiella emersonii ATCC 22665]|nr:pre-rRNA processing protein [Blastocladiella emersonii ATCC 22665]
MKKDSFFVAEPTPRRSASGTATKKRAGAPADSERPAKRGRASGAPGSAAPMKVKGKVVAADVSSDDEAGAGSDIDRTVYSSADEADGEGADEADAHESAADKRLRLAQAYLSQVKGDLARKGKGEYDAADLDRDLIAERLRDGALEARGRLWRELATQFLASPVPELSKFPRCHQLSPTCLAVAPNRKHLFSGGKDGAVVQWDLATRGKVRAILGLQKKAPASAVGHTREVNCLAASSQYLVSGGNDSRLNVWSVHDGAHVKQFNGHRDAITGAVFRKGSQSLYTSSRDRTVKTWNLDEMTYVESLFGHQDPVAAIDTVAREHCVTAGGRDKTMRLWKIVEESQLLFRASSFHGSLDVVYQVTEDMFISGDDHGNLSLWHTSKKKAVFSVQHAHGFLPQSDQDKDFKLARKPYWITALTGIKFSDLFFSGSWSGDVKCWKINRAAMRFDCVATLPVTGVVNALALLEPADFPPALSGDDADPAVLGAEVAASADPDHALTLFVAAGQEHKDGRWWRVKEARNSVYAFNLTPNVPVVAKKAKKPLVPAVVKVEVKSEPPASPPAVPAPAAPKAVPGLKRATLPTKGSKRGGKGGGGKRK